MRLGLTRTCIFAVSGAKRTMPAKRDRLSYGNVSSRPCPRCNGYLGIVLREPGRNAPVRAVNGHCLKCGYRLAWIVIKGKQAARISSYERSDMLNPQKTLERQALLRRHRELQAEIAQHERNMREGEARLPIEEQLRLKLRRLIEIRFMMGADAPRLERDPPRNEDSVSRHHTSQREISDASPRPQFFAELRQ